MITQELISYIRAEINKGKTREEVRTALLSGGGWSDADISEAFRTVMPVGSTNPTPVPASGVKPVSINPRPTQSGSPFGALPPLVINPSKYTKPVSGAKAGGALKGFFIFTLLALMAFGGYFFKDQILEVVSGIKDRVSNISLFKEETIIVPPVEERKEVIIPTAPIVAKNCGVTTAPSIDGPMLENDTVLNCIGESAASCTWARAVFTDPLFPTQVEIVTSGVQGDMNCSFNVSYASNSTLTSFNGKSLAGEYIVCPVKEVKAATADKEGKLTFSNPSTGAYGKYASEIYLYATTGVFIENDFEQEKIYAKGCVGSFVDSVIESYKLMNSKS